MSALQRRIPIALLITSFAAAAIASKNAPPARYFLQPDAIDPIALLPPPPIAGSAEAAMEMEVVRNLQKTRTPADIARAHSEKKITIAAFTAAVGPWFTRENLPAVNALLQTLDANSKRFIAPAKSFFKRPRPALAASDLNDEHDASYPSGHSTLATVDALVLCELMPQCQGKLLARAQEIGWDRVIAGVHFPSDIDAGRVLGQAIARALLATPDFRSTLEAARAEIAAVRPSEKSAAVGASAH